MKIAHILPSFEVGGQEVFVLRLARRLVERGWSVVAVGATGAGALERDFGEAGVSVRVVQESNTVPGYPSALIRVLRAEAPDVLHCHSGTWFPTAIAGRRLGCRVVHTEHGRYPEEPWWVSWADRLAHALTDAVVVVSQALDRDLRRRLRTSRPFPMIANGVTVRPRKSGDRERARSEFPVGAGSFVVGTVGRLVAAKNHAGLIEAIGHLVTQGRDVTLVVIGDGPLRSQLEELVSARDLAGRVRLMGHRADATDLLPGMDVYASSSVTEGTPIAVLEAMAAGLPIVATDVGGLSHLLDAGRAGILVPVHEAAALAAALDALITDATRRERLAMCAQQRAAAAFSLDAAVSQYEDLYRSLWATGNAAGC